MSFDTGSAGSVNLGSARGEIVVSMDDAQRQLNRQIGQLERGVTSSFGRIGSNVQDLGMNLTKVLAPVTGFVIAGGLAFAQFDDVLTEIEARTGATAEQMEQVRLTALQMGQDTAFSATQASEGMLELMSSGFSLDQTMTALAPVLDLAAAGMLDLGFASDAVTDVLAQFSLGAEDARMVADALAQASGSSSATITDLIQGFANVGPVAANFGLDVRETAAALSVFSENGIKGAQAGTNLKSMLTNMASDVPKVTAMWDELGVRMFDAEGNMRNFDDIIDDLNVSMEGMSDQERIRVIKTLGGAYGQTGLSALLAADGIDTMLGTMDDATTAADLGAARMDSFKGQVNQLKSSLETLMLHVIGPLVEDYLQPLVEEAVRVLNVFNAWLMLNPELAASLGVILGVLAILGPAIKLLGMVITAVLSPLGLLVAAFGVALKFNLFGVRDALDRVIDGFKMYAKILRMGGSRTKAMQVALKKTFGQGALDRITEFWESIRNAITSMWNVVAPVINQIIDTINDLLRPFGGLGKVLKTFGKILIGAMIPPLGILMKFGVIFKGLSKIFKGGAKNIGKNVGNLFGDLVDRLEGFVTRIFDTIATLGVDLLPKVVGWARNIGEGLIGGLSSLGTSLWQNALQPALQSLGTWISSGQAATDFGNLAKSIKNGLASALSVIAAGATMLWDDFLAPGIINTVQWITTGQALHDFEDLAKSVQTGLSSAFTTIAKGATMIWESFLKPAILDTVEWVKSGQAATDFVTLVNAIISGLKAAFNSYNRTIDWMWVNVVKPMVMDVIEWVGSGQATTDFITLVKAIIQAISDAFAAYDVAIDWMYVNVVWPLLSDVIKWIGSGQAATDMLTLAGAMMDAMMMAFAEMKTSGDWLWMNVFKPMVMDIIAWFLSGKADADLHNIATELMNGLARSFTLLGEGVVWLWTKVLRPMIISAVAYLASGEASMDFELIANGILNSLTSAFNTVVTGANQLWNDVLHPMILAAISYVQSGKAQADLKVLGESLLEQLKVGLADIAAWADVNIVQPIVTEMELLPGKIEAALTALETAFATTFDAIGVMAANLSVSVVSGIASTFNDVIDVVNGFIDSYNAVAGPLPGISGISRLSHISFQKGTPWTGSGPLDQPAGVVENREAVVPAHGMSVTPSPRGLQLNGLIDMLQRTLNKVFEGIDGTLLSSMTGQGGAAPLGAVAGAGGLGGGNDTNLNFMGDIKLMVSDETLRDPEMASRARQFGQEFRAGVLTNDDIMEKVRGKS